MEVARLVSRLAHLALCATVAACVTVRVTDDSGNTRVERHAGFVKVTLPESAKFVSAETWVLGFGIDPMTTAIGFGRSRVSIFPNDCRLIIWTQGAEQIAQWGSHLRGITDVCFVNPNREGPGNEAK